MGSITLNLYYQAPREALAELCSSLAQIHGEARSDVRLLPQSLIRYFNACASEITEGNTDGCLQRNYSDEVHIMPVTAAQLYSRTHPDAARVDLGDLAEQCYALEGDGYRFHLNYTSIGLDGLFNPDSLKTLDVTFSYNRGHSLEPTHFEEQFREAITEQEKQSLITRMLENQQKMAAYTLRLAQDIFYPNDRQDQLMGPTALLIRGFSIEPIRRDSNVFDDVPKLYYKHSLKI